MDFIVDEELHARLPELPSDALALLEASILTEGCRDPLVLWGLIVVDGRNRLEICQRHNIQFKTVQRDFQSRSDARMWIIRNQFARRNLSTYERAELALELEVEVKAAAKERQISTLKQNADVQNSAPREDAGKSRQAIAQIAGVSHDTIAKTKAIRDEAIPEVRDMVRSGGVSIHAASQIASMDAAEQQEIVQDIASGTKPVDAIKQHVHVAQNSGENEWYTPLQFIDAARLVMGSIDTDPASSEIANKTVGASVYFTKDDDGLTQQWNGNVWMNPPYAQPLIRLFCEAVVRKYHDKEIEQAIVLVNNGTETAWGQILLTACSAVCFPASRIKFIDKSGNPSGTPLQGQMIVYLGEHGHEFMDEFSQFGAVL